MRRARTLAALLAAALSTSCAWSESSNWFLHDAGYSVRAGPAPDEFAFRVHVNELKYLGGEIDGAEFKRFVSERLDWSDLCPRGWEFLPCVKDGSCVHRTRHSVTVPGHCLEP